MASSALRPGAQPAPLTYNSHATLASATPVPAVIVATITITSTYSGPQALPISVAYTITVVGGSVNSGNDSVNLAISYGTNLIANVSEPVASGVTSYTVPVGYAELTSNNYAGGNLPFGGAYSLEGWLTANNTTVPTNRAVTVHSAVVLATLEITNVAVDFTNTVNTYEPTGFQLNFSVNVTGNAGVVGDGNNLTIALAITYPTGTRTPAYAVNETLRASREPCTANSPPFPTCAVLTSAFMPFSGFYLYVLWATAKNINDPAQELRVAGANGHVAIATSLPSATILAPLGGSIQSVGNVTISAEYTGDFATSANVTVWSASGSLVDVAGIFSPGLGSHAGSFVWVATTAGTYTIVVSVVTPYSGVTTATEAITITPAATVQGPQTIWYNTTDYVNSSVTKTQGVFGLGPGVGAAILLVVGAVVGLVVAMVLGRMMWGSGGASPAQPWKAKGNECSICHQSFDSAEQLAEHSKSAHGM